MNWKAHDIERLLGGSTWLTPPDHDLMIQGASIYAPSYRPGDMIFVRDAEGDFGITPATIMAEKLNPPLAIVGPKYAGRPLAFAGATLKVFQQHDALVTLAKDARQRLAAPVIGVTGSAGKTSVTAMIRHCLEGAGPVYATRFGANMARGISWNMCCVPEEVRHCVFEMAIGQMTWNSQIAQPDVAVFTNIYPAHLIYHKDLRTIAQRKAQIFSAMAPTGTAVINADMFETTLVQAAAIARGLRVLTYGQGAGNDIRLMEVNVGYSEVKLEVSGTYQIVPTVGTGNYAVQNAMAVAGALWALGMPVATTMASLKQFQNVPGRGATVEISTPGGLLQILDHSYNANPASMRAALDELALMMCHRQRIAILGHMAELGESSEAQHRALLKDLRTRSIDSIYLLGCDFHALKDEVADDARFTFTDLNDLQKNLLSIIRPGDAVMIKGSNSTGLYKIMDKFRNI